MAYITKAEMLKRFGGEIDQLLDRDNDGSEDAGVFDDAEQDARALIDGYLATLYTLPLAETPNLIKELAADITRYELWDDRASEEVRKRYEDAIARLKDIAKGLMKLPDSTGTPIETAGGDIAYTERTRTFDDCTLDTYVNGPRRGFDIGGY